MKTLINYINESLRKNDFSFFTNGVFKLKIETDPFGDDATKTSVAKQQETEIIDIINSYLVDSDYKALSYVDYDKDAKYGNIVIVDDSNSPVMFIEVKVSDRKNSLGAITIDSLLNFGKTSNDNYYLLLSDLGVKHKFVKGKDVWNEFEKDKTLLVSKTRKNKIDFADAKVEDWDGRRARGEVYAEDFIPETTIDKVKPAF